MSDSLPLFAACQPGLEPFLLAELEALGFRADGVPGGATFDGGLDALMRACLWLGTASHVRVRLAQFRCRALGELERKAAEFAWRDWLTPKVPLDLRASAKRSRVYHTGAIQERLYKAIGRAFGADPVLARKGDEVTAPLHVRFVDDTCTVSLDATSTPLHRRGYRLDGRKAPLREDIAHALVLASGFGPGDALLDPFCGSGTIAIEAAAIARCVPPGRLRPPPLQHSARFDHDAWQRLVAEPQPNEDVPLITCSDRDDGAVAAARANAERAGVADALQVEAHAIAAHPGCSRTPLRREASWSRTRPTACGSRAAARCCRCTKPSVTGCSAWATAGGRRSSRTTSASRAARGSAWSLPSRRGTAGSPSPPWRRRRRTTARERERLTAARAVG